MIQRRIGKKASGCLAVTGDDRDKKTKMVSIPGWDDTENHSHGMHVH